MATLHIKWPGPLKPFQRLLSPVYLVTLLQISSSFGRIIKQNWHLCTTTLHKWTSFCSCEPPSCRKTILTGEPAISNSIKHFAITNVRPAISVITSFTDVPANSLLCTADCTRGTGNHIDRRYRKWPPNTASLWSEKPLSAISQLTYFPLPLRWGPLSHVRERRRAPGAEVTRRDVGVVSLGSDQRGAAKPLKRTHWSTTVRAETTAPIVSEMRRLNLVYANGGVWMSRLSYAWANVRSVCKAVISQRGKRVNFRWDGFLCVSCCPLPWTGSRPRRLELLSLSPFWNLCTGSAITHGVGVTDLSHVVNDRNGCGRENGAKSD